MAALDRASFVYASNDPMTSEVKEALKSFDQDNTGRASTSELAVAFWHFGISAWYDVKVKAKAFLRRAWRRFV